MFEKICYFVLIIKVKSYKEFVCFYSVYFLFLGKGIIFKGYKRLEKIYFLVDMRYLI